ncbi:MAG: MarR family winged helix-turn-helix transcriptional regulator [Lysobacterales bacterium]
MLELDRFLPYRLSVLSNRISAAIAGDYAERFDLSVTEWRVLAILGRAPGASASEVAERAAMDKVAVSRAVGSLLAAGRLKRSHHANDRRRSVLSLSARGRRIYQQIVPLALARERVLRDALGSRDRAALERILAKLDAATTPPTD